MPVILELTYNQLNVWCANCNVIMQTGYIKWWCPYCNLKWSHEGIKDIIENIHIENMHNEFNVVYKKNETKLRLIYDKDNNFSFIGFGFVDKYLNLKSEFPTYVDAQKALIEWIWKKYKLRIFLHIGDSRSVHQQFLLENEFMV